MIKRVFAPASVVAVVVLGGLSLSACATQEYVDHRIAEVNDHINAVDAKATQAGEKADAAMTAAQAAQAAASQNGQRIDQLSTRVDTLQTDIQQQQQTTTTRTPRG
jgi:outer membrane murein-binding lipoprotein Lpp